MICLIREGLSTNLDECKSHKDSKRALLDYHQAHDLKSTQASGMHMCKVGTLNLDKTGIVSQRLWKPKRAKQRILAPFISH
jgi:hypothetical protein